MIANDVPHTLPAVVRQLAMLAQLRLMQQWADDYFYIPMRKEHVADAFVRDVARGFMPSYLPLAVKRGSEVSFAT